MNNLITPPRSWLSMQDHYKTVLHSEWYKILTKLGDQFMRSTVDFYTEKGFKFMLLPITTGTISSPMGLGSDSKPVKINLEGHETYLADSMQFFLEFGCRINQEGVYYVAPSFRGELADERHLCQFYHSEAEIIGDLDDVINLCEKYMEFLVRDLLGNCQKEITSVAGDVKHLQDFLEKVNNIPRCTFDEAVKRLNNDSQYLSVKDGIRSINSLGEKELMKQFGGVVWLTHFDHMTVPFYQSYDPKDSEKAMNADLLIGIGETIGAGQRHLTGNQVKDALAKHNVDQEEYEWYIDLKNEVQLQTSGFGMGVERFLLWATQQNDIRDMQLLPRFNGEKIVF